MVPMKAVLLCALLAGLALAGCSGKATDAPTGGSIPDPGEVQATDTTGGVRGVVVDQAIRPIKAAHVSVGSASLSKNVTTDASGTFVVNGLPAGTYIVKGTHPLYSTVQQAVEVQAGVKNPAPIKLQLTQKVSDRPYMTTLLFKGFVVCSVGAAFTASEECGEGVGLPCQPPAPEPPFCHRFGGQGDNHVQYDFGVDGPYVRSIVIEQAWKPTSDATGKFYTVAPATNWTCDPSCGGNQIADMAGASPLLSRIEVVQGVALSHAPIVRASGTTWNNETVTANTKFSTFTWPQWGGCGAISNIPNNPTCAGQANLATNQEFKLFISSFYFLPAPDGWSLVDGGTNPFA
ncbi:MAG: Carboxypeptidase regulatory-like domain [Thermoplasmata archaeon]|jgi:hypothetical protein|nr:Carboxypeptidase regulatory-like domain [Thermoplasmata archaeon]